MAITGTTTDYTNRTKDLFISQGIQPQTSGTYDVTYSFGAVSQYIAGVQKLIQRYVISLINTGLLTTLRAARYQNIQEATHIFNHASWAVVTSFSDYQNKNPGMPTDEQINSAALVDISAAPGRISMSVQLTTKAGDNVTFVMPLTF